MTSPAEFDCRWLIGFVENAGCSSNPSQHCGASANQSGQKLPKQKGPDAKCPGLSEAGGEVMVGMGRPGETIDAASVYIRCLVFIMDKNVETTDRKIDVVAKSVYVHRSI